LIVYILNEFDNCRSISNNRISFTIYWKWYMHDRGYVHCNSNFKKRESDDCI